MTAVWVVLTGIGVVLGLDLFLSVAIIRRLRTVAQRVGLALDVAQGVAQPTTEASLGAGMAVPEFRATDLQGGAVSSDTLPPEAIVVFVSSECDACREHMKVLRKEMGRLRGVRLRPITVVVGDARLGSDLIQAAGELGPVISEPRGDGLALAFQVDMFPTFFVIGEGSEIAARIHTADRLVKRFQTPSVLVGGNGRTAEAP